MIQIFCKTNNFFKLRMKAIFLRKTIIKNQIKMQITFLLIIK